MEDILAIQHQLVGAIEQVYSNFREDGPERKTGDYIKRRLETLDQYWQEFQSNHVKLCGLGIRSHEYFINKQFDQTKERYEHIRSAIQSYQVREARPSTPLLKPATPLGVCETSHQPAGAEMPAARPGTSHQGVSNESAATAQSITFRAQGVNSRTDELLRKQASNFRALQRKVTSLDLSKVTEKWEFDDLLRTFQSRWSAIDSLHLEIDSELEGKNQEYENTFNHYEEVYEEIKKAINRKMWSVCHRDKSTPQMELPVFSGNFQHWTSFKDLFTETIHNNPSLSNAQKMQFLKGKLRGEAERLVQHLQIGSDNYITCWDILNNRYNNRKLIFTSHINILMNISVSQQPSFEHIKKIHDTSLESLNAIKNLGVDISTWDPLLVHILSQKLDSDTYNEYVSSLKQPRELPSLKEFLEFLESKFNALETSRKKNYYQETSSSNYNYNKSNKYKKPTYVKQTLVSSNKFAQSTSGQHNSKFTKNCPMCNKSEHGLYYCPKFLDLPSHLKRKIIIEKNLCQNCLYDHQGKACFSEKRCRECNANHNSILHEAFSNKAYASTSKDTRASCNNVSKTEQVQGNKHVMLQGQEPEILLATAVIKVQARDGSYHSMRALLDQGSQASLISEKAAHVLGLPRRRCRGVITGIGDKDNICKGVITLKCQSYHEDFSFKTDAFIMKSLIKCLPSSTFPKPNWPLLDHLPLADKNYNLSNQIDILLAADIYSIIILEGIYRAGPNLPIAQKTRLGWILSGYVERTLQCNVTLNNVDDIHQFWQIEDISEQSSISSEDERVMEFYINTTVRHPDGRYEVRLPLKSTINQDLGLSRNKAVAQFKQLERKFMNQEEVAEQYKLFIHEYLSLNHMNPTCNSTLGYYLPHHCVFREESSTSRVRVVFNGSAKQTTSGSSLNDLMERGPNLQQDLQGLIIKWRQYRYGFTADIEKMFRQVWLHQDDQIYQKIIWRDSPLDKLQEYQLATVTYGTKAAPFLAMMTLRQLANDEKQNYPDSLAPSVIQSSFFMDDLVYGCHSVDQAKQLILDMINIMKSGGFNLRKWRSNNEDILRSLQGNQDQVDYTFKHAESSKTLGLSWNPQEDKFTFTAKIEFSSKKQTKRSFLSDMSKLFDPLGWLSPISTKIKILFQQVWQLDIQWDDPLPQNIEQKWIKIKTEMVNIQQFDIPRWLGTTANASIELHGFSDASTKAYACVVYCKMTHQGHTSVTMIAGKARLVPNSKTFTLPKLELCGALLLIKLMAKIKECLEGYHISTCCWVDSMVVLGWINGDPERWKPFVANRIKQITSEVAPTSWKYVKSEDNPADCASRGLTVSQLRDHKLWWNGPTWLPTFNVNEQKKNQASYTTDQEVRKAKQVATIVIKEESIIKQLLSKYSSFSKITRILAWVYRFISKKQARKPYLTLSELNQAKIKIIKHVQHQYFYQEIADLQKGNQVSTKSKICMLNPIIDQDQVLRVGGRLKHARIILDMKHPIIIPKNSRLSDLIIDQCHELTYHGGARLTSAFMRQKYWLIGGIRNTKKRIRQCVKCRKHSPSRHYQIMGDLPASRVNPSRPFYHTGVDYTGHVFIKSNKGRGIKTTKGYVAVFVCMVTKAIHLELVSDLTTSAFLAALRRMSSRRGVPKHMYSDQGTTFIGANKVLQQEYEEIKETFNDQFMNEVVEMGIKWHFNAPSWPSAGGLWEASVKSLKHHLKRVIGEQRLTFEEYSTLLSQLEACLNQRPLCPLTEDPEDLDCLTPSHFLTSGPNLAFYNTETDLRTRWHLTQHLFEDIWKRWQSEYLTQLSIRSKWTRSQANIEINDVVIIHDANLPAGRWLLGRVIQLHPGSDGQVRVVTLKTKNGIMKRPIVKLSILPIHQENRSPPTNTANKQANLKQTYYVSQSRIKHTYSLSKMVFALLMFMLTLIASTEGSYNITPFQNDRSLYFDKITNMGLIKDEWRLVVYYDMSPYWEGSQVLNKYTEYLQNICSKIKDRSQCEAIMLQLQHGNEQLLHYNNFLLNKQNMRTRRGLINGIGSVANSLFGILDSNFADKYEKDIQLIKENQEHLSLLWKNQTSVVEAEFNLLQRTENIMTKQHKAINQRLQKLENMVFDLKIENLNNSVINDFTLSAMIANNILLHLKDMQDTLLDTLTDIYNGQMSFHLLTPDQLLREINIITGKISKDLSVPFDSNNLPKIYRLLKTKARMSKNYIIFETKIPLVHRDTYEIYKVIPIPRLHHENIMVHIEPVSNYLAINLRKDILLPMKESDLHSCLHQDLNTILCMIRSPVYHIKEDDNLCKRDNVTSKCNTYQEPCEIKWYELNQINNYFYFCCDQCQVKLLCADQITPVQLSNAGVLTAGEGCIIKFKDFNVYTHKQGMNNVHIQADLEVPTLSPINHLINLSIPISPNYTVEADLAEHTKQLIDIRERIDEMQQTVPLYNTISNHNIHHYAVAYIIVAVLVVVAMFWLIRKIRQRSSVAAGEAAVASPQAVAQPRDHDGASAQPVAQPRNLDGPSEQCFRVPRYQRRFINSDQCRNDVGISQSVQCLERPNVNKQNKYTSPAFQAVYVVGNDNVKYNSL